MATVTQSQIAAHEAGRKVNEAAFESVAASLKSNYLKLKRGSSANLTASPDDSNFDAYIETLAYDVLDGKSDRAQKIRTFIAQRDHEQYEKLEKVGAIRNAAAKAAYDNTGDFEFLGGSTVMNALAGLIKWIFSGFDGGFDGLQKIIAEGAAANATASFSENLKQQGIDPTQGFGQDAVAQFAEQAEVKAGLRESSAKKPFSLADVEVSGLKEEKAAAAQEKPVEAKTATDVPAKLAEHFDNVSNEALAAVKVQMPETMLKQYDTLLTQAKTTLAQKGTELAQQAIAGGKGLPDNFEFAVIHETFRDTLEKIDPAKDKQAHDMVEKIVKAFDAPDATLISVNETLRKDKQTMDAPIIINTIHEVMTKKEAKTQLIDIMKVAQPSNQAALDAQAKMVDQQAEEAAQQALLGRRETAKSHVTQALEESFVPLDIQVQIDRGVNGYIQDNYPTTADKATNSTLPWLGWEVPLTRYAKSSVNWAAEKTVGIDNRLTQFFGQAPSADERKQLAGFIAEKMKPIVESEINTRIDGGMQDLPVDGVVKESMQHFDKAFDEAIKDGTLSNTWSAYQSVIRNTMENRLREKLQESKPKLSGILGETSGKVTMRVDPNGAALAMAGVTLDTSNAAVTAPSPGYDARGGRREISRGGDASRPVGPGALPAPIV